MESVLCSDCFQDPGLRMDAEGLARSHGRNMPGLPI